MWWLRLALRTEPVQERTSANYPGDFLSKFPKAPVRASRVRRRAMPLNQLCWTILWPCRCRARCDIHPFERRRSHPRVCARPQADCDALSTEQRPDTSKAEEASLSMRAHFPGEPSSSGERDVRSSGRGVVATPSRAAKATRSAVPKPSASAWTQNRPIFETRERPLTKGV